MFRTSFVYHPRLALLAGLLACALSAHAAPPLPTQTGLGQAWPNAQDVSLNPLFHVYKFNRDGIDYVQFNDANGNVRAAFAYAGGVVLKLPMGSDASLVLKPEQTRMNASASTGAIIYRDAHIQVTMAPQADGLVWNVLSVQPNVLGSTKGSTAASCSVQECGGGIINQISMQQQAASSCVPVQECGGGLGNQIQAQQVQADSSCPTVQECGGGKQK